MSKTVPEDKSNISTNCRLDSELETKVRRSSERICENLHIIANEPSLALYRISEHVRKALPPTVESRCEVKRLHAQLCGAHYDAEYGLTNIQAMDAALPRFVGIGELLRQSILARQHFKHEQPNRRVKKEGGSSLYQRFSVHLPSVDIPDLADFKESARETAQRVESAIGKDKPTASTTKTGGGGVGGGGARPKSAVLQETATSPESHPSHSHRQPAAPHQPAAALVGGSDLTGGSGVVSHETSDLTGSSGEVSHETGALTGGSGVVSHKTSDLTGGSGVVSHETSDISGGPLQQPVIDVASRKAVK